MKDESQVMVGKQKTRRETFEHNLYGSNPSDTEEKGRWIAAMLRARRFDGDGFVARNDRKFDTQAQFIRLKR